MISRRAVIGVSVLSGLLICAFAAQTASALIVTPSPNTTAFTCVAKPNGGFSDAHCDNVGAGDFGHEFIALNTTTEINLTNQKVTNATKDAEPKVFKTTIGLAKVTIECTTGGSNTKNSKVHNIEPASGQHTFTGTVETELSTCNVKELAKCTIAEPVIFKSLVHGVEKMLGPKGEPNAMGLEFVGHGPEEAFGEFAFKNKGAEACSLNGKSFPVKGRMIATNGPTTESKQDNKHSGATLVFTPKNSMQTLKIGPNTATFETVSTATMVGGNPIAMTTTT